MSEENVAMRRLYEAVGRHDTDAVLSAYDPNVEFDFSGGPLASLMGDKVYRGHAGLRKMNRDRYLDFETVEDDCRELIDAGQRVISLVITRTRGRSSGIDTEYRQYCVWTIRDGKVIRVELFRQRAEALEAAGLSE